MSVSSFNDVPDMDLVRRHGAGDAAAFVEIMRRHRPKVHALALSMLRDRTDADEITQDVFIRVHRGLGKFRGECSLASWLYGMTANLCRNRYWYWRRRRRHVTSSLESQIGDDGSATVADIVACANPLPSIEAELAELTAMIDVGMAGLSPRFREILTMRNVLHQSYEEIAAALNLKVGTVKSRIARAREHLRARIAHELPASAEREAKAS